MSIRKRISILALSLIFAVSFCTFSYADSGSSNKTYNKTYNAKTAFINDVDEYGRNFCNDTVDGSKNTQKDTPLSVTQNRGGMTISGNINGSPFSITATPFATNEKKTVIYYSAVLSTARYRVVTMSFEKNIAESGLYFTSQRTSEGTVLRIILRDERSRTRDYIVLELFDYSVPDFDDVASGLKEDITTAWYAAEFLPIAQSTNEEEADDYQSQTRDTRTNSAVGSYTETFLYLGYTVRHTIKFRMHCDYTDIPIGFQANQKYRVTITEKSITSREAPDLNSSTMCTLNITGVTIYNGAIPNAAFYSTSVDGVLTKRSSIIQYLSFGIGLSLYGLGINISIPADSAFENAGNVDLNTAYNTYENGVDGVYTKFVRTQMDNDYYLWKTGQYFEVMHILKDYGNVAVPYSTMRAQWHLFISNIFLGTQPYEYTYNQNLTLRIM